MRERYNTRYSTPWMNWDSRQTHTKRDVQIQKHTQTKSKSTRNPLLQSQRGMLLKSTHFLFLETLELGERLESGAAFLSSLSSTTSFRTAWLRMSCELNRNGDDKVWWWWLVCESLFSHLIFGNSASFSFTLRSNRSLATWRLQQLKIVSDLNSI